MTGTVTGRMGCIPIFARQRNVCDGVVWCEQTLTKLVNLPSANEVWGKVMFSQVFVCPRGEGRVGFPACITGHMTSIGGWGGAASRGVCLQEVCIQGVYPMEGGGGSAYEVGGRPRATRKAGCTHPTGMVSCCNQILGSSADQNYVAFID